MTQLDRELIDSYLENDLSADDRQRFEARLAADERFAKDFEEHKYLRNTIYRYFKTRETLAATRAALEAKGLFDRKEPEEPNLISVRTAPARRERPWYVYFFWTVLALFVLILIVFFADLIRHLKS